AGRVDLAHRLARAITEQPLSRQLLALQQNPRELAVVQPALDQLAGLRLEPEPDAVAFDRRVAALQGRQTDRAVLVEIAAVADADARQVEQLRGCGQHGALVRLVRSCDGEILADTPPNAAEHRREVGEPSVLRVLAPFAPFGMVDVLLAAFLVAAGRLDVPP